MHDNLWISAISALALAAAGGATLRWLRAERRRRHEIRRAQGYRLIHSLRAYSAWMECQRDLPFTTRSLDELTSPSPLTLARQIKRDYFPSLQQMVPLLQAHSRMIEYLWEQSLLRLTQGSGWQPAWQPAWQDAQYQQLRGSQEDLINEIIAGCRELIGDSAQVWRRTGSDFAFSNSVSRASEGPASGA